MNSVNSKFNIIVIKFIISIIITINYLDFTTIITTNTSALIILTIICKISLVFIFLRNSPNFAIIIMVETCSDHYYYYFTT